MSDLTPKYDHHEQLCKDINDLYRRKNADYGDSFGKSVRKRGITAAMVRLDDKWNRIDALTTPAGGHSQKPQVKDETVRDTLMDMANYLLMLITEIDVAQGRVEGIDTTGYERLREETT